ncbi:HEAT repeat protein [Aspergillus ellipticus CBS 707.79]|uniref:HEAT repeat protein n=1 Tax=Aspergillus ellipticus CBS 707.79 TaxID=1448320 RepID=A0A319DX91_9EURO|nr:HEAT repeat protein [Aspergillus ellipticus CBS 707.79]
MEVSRQEAFTKLKPVCVELSAVGLRFRGHQATPNDVFQALNSVYKVLDELASKNSLDEKLAEYAFFPLCHIFNETQRTPVNSLEVSVKCLRILVEKGWRKRLSPPMGKQLMILLTLIVGGTPNTAGGKQSPQIRSPELSIAGYDCLLAIFNAMEGSEATETVYHEMGTATVVDQVVYLLLEGIADDGSDELCISAAKALLALFQRITDRVVLASIMPRTVSTLTRVIKPSTQIRRSFKLLSICLHVFNYLVKMVLNDQVSKVPQKSAPSKNADDQLVLDGSWLKATSTQIKLALTNVIQIRRHDRPEVQAALLELCLMVIEDCQNTLQEALPIIVETVVVLAEVDENQTPNEAFLALKHHATTYTAVVDSLKNSLHTWVTSFPRTMQSNDETAKQWAVKQISTAFQILSQIQSGSDILVNSLASGICDSVAAAVSQTTNTLQPLSSGLGSNQTLEVLHHGSESASFPPVILEHRSQQQTLNDLQSMIVKLNASESGNEITCLIINRVHREHGNSLVAPFWLALKFLNSSTQLTSIFDDFISTDELEPSSQNLTRTSMIEELYYVSLPILNDPLADESNDWRLQALALEVVALQAQQLGKAFRPELMDALYPVLQLLASNNPSLQKHAMTCLNILTTACNYGDASTMIIENVDYLVNSVALKLNTFDVSPYPPQVLLMMVKLCGVRLVPYLDDLVDSIFSILDMYHGYPRLVEMMFRTLAAIVEEGTQTPSFLAIGDGTGVDHRKKQFERLQISTLAEDIARRKTKRAKLAEELGDDDDETISHPKKPWTREPEKTEQEDPNLDSFSDLLKEEEDNDEPLPPPREPEDSEKPLTKSHTLLLHIVKSIPSHLSSPSPYLRRSLLSILIDVFPTLAAHENSFLPLINDIWPSVAARISFPTSFTNPSSTSTTLMTTTTRTSDIADTRLKQNASEFDFQEEIFVSTTACKAIETMCRSAGDFMASRVETEFPRWERLYTRAWDKVRQDADAAIERRAAKATQSSSSSLEKPDNLDTSLSLAFTQSLSLTTTGSHGTRAFTPHHTLWRAMVPLFISLLTHVRLPLSVGDKICELLAAWIVRYAGPEYFSSRSQVQNSHNKEDDSGVSSLQVEIESVEGVIHAMETWNADLTWFVFQEQKARLVNTLARTRRTTPAPAPAPKIVDLDEEPLKSWSITGTQLRFAEMVF